MTIDEIRNRKEDQTFDCKSIHIDPKALAVPIVAMANADGGVLAIGVSDKTRRICKELESRGAVIPYFHTDAFILKAILKAEFVEESIAIKGNYEKINVADHVADKLTERQILIMKILETFVANNVADKIVPNTKYLADSLGVSRKTVQRELFWLQDKKLIRWIGTDRSGYWEIVNHKPNNI